MHPAELPIRDLQMAVDRRYHRHVPILRLFVQNPSDGTGPGPEKVRISMGLAHGSFIDADGRGATVAEAASNLIAQIRGEAVTYPEIKPVRPSVWRRLLGGLR